MKESKYQYPVVTDVIFDYSMMLKMIFHSMTIIEKGYGVVGVMHMLNSIYTYYRDLVKFIERLIREKGIKFRIIIQTTKINIETVKSMILFNK
ncbi:MAG TPA: hypothetical protein VFG45_05810 [Candidatus Nitrosocosmicus sp.]|nr:hypothetical protein [Candidatus Nitrosocosmicus sp.]